MQSIVHFSVRFPVALHVYCGSGNETTQPFSIGSIDVTFLTTPHSNQSLGDSPLKLPYPLDRQSGMKS